MTATPANYRRGFPNLVDYEYYTTRRAPRWADRLLDLKAERQSKAWFAKPVVSIDEVVNSHGYDERPKCASENDYHNLLNICWSNRRRGNSIAEYLREFIGNYSAEGQYKTRIAIAKRWLKRIEQQTHNLTTV